MKYIYIVFFSLMLLMLQSCKVNKYPKMHVIYKGSEEYYFPDYKIEILFKNDSIAYFKNYVIKNSTFIQKFNYIISDDMFLHVKNLDTINSNLVSLKNNDTIVLFKNKLYYPYSGNGMYYLFFKRK